MRRITVRTSPIHGRGVFALADLPTGALLLEYKGLRLSWKEAQRMHEKSNAENGHTFLFGLDDGSVIDGARGGNSARWLNHSCAPNCEAEQDGERVFIRAIRPIGKGQELFIDYCLTVDGRRTAAVKRLYACRCSAPGCRGTMLSASR
ncbi:MULTISPECIES: SET domain-containing protein [Caballeronia]|uniref:Nuclear protein SET n=1 Tax=Caballeronia cordobensis TaxID=1353886 RepID=A0A158GJY3_CABCO|nr:MULTISPECIES: SET domain-containing protein-lysine N-methyltransferase [Caballeronia]MCE4546125.1 SET domain-containing protein-lysine N-methyltransferase [Caballeronia sp. PC1]MCE4573400.1 SET domain-containing protein-lysine N-methyltransferase [Caballeronia sp. CLC5]SAL32342.1 nuclear protein SET [Caballeronia cordobensis]